MIITLKGANFSGAGNNIGNLSQIGGTFTFTINPTPSDSTVKINGTARKSITGAYGTAISWEVSKNGYNTRTGSLTMPLGGKTMSVSLTAVGSTTPPVTPEQPGTGGGSGSGSGTTGNGQWLSVLVTGDKNAHTEFMNYTETIGQLTNVPCAYVKPEIQKHLSGKRVTKVACYVLGSDSSISFYTNDYSASGTTSGDSAWKRVYTLSDPSSKVAAGTKTKKEYDVDFTIEEGDTLAFYDMVKMNSPANKEGLMSYVLPVNYTMNPGQKYGTALPNFIAFDFYVE